MLTTTELAEHIRQHLLDDKSAIEQHLAALRDADVAEVLNMLTRPEAAEVLTLLASDRAASLAAQPTLTRRGALFAELEPARAAALLDDLPADQRTEVLRQMCAPIASGCCPSSRPPHGLRPSSCCRTRRTRPAPS